jgi:hypothetical protein
LSLASLILGLAVLAAPEARSALGLTGPTAADRGVGEQRGPLVAPAHIPALTSDDQARASAMTMSDGRVQAVLVGQQPAVDGSGPWQTFGDRMIGAVVEVSLPAATTLHGTWPLVDYDETEQASPPYSVTPVAGTATGLQHILVFVDLTRQGVIGFEPGPEATFTPDAPVARQPRGPED